jgi:hypothetical protein
VITAQVVSPEGPGGELGQPVRPRRGRARLGAVPGGVGSLGRGGDGVRTVRVGTETTAVLLGRVRPPRLRLGLLGPLQHRQRVAPVLGSCRLNGVERAEGEYGRGGRLIVVLAGLLCQGPQVLSADGGDIALVVQVGGPGGRDQPGPPRSGPRSGTGNRTPRTPRPTSPGRSPHTAAPAAPRRRPPRPGSGELEGCRTSGRARHHHWNLPGSYRLRAGRSGRPMSPGVSSCVSGCAGGRPHTRLGAHRDLASRAPVHQCSLRAAPAGLRRGHPVPPGRHLVPAPSASRAVAQNSRRRPLYDAPIWPGGYVPYDVEVLESGSPMPYLRQYARVPQLDEGPPSCLNWKLEKIQD